MTESADSTLVRALAERIVKAVAPDEIEMFPALADVYEAKPEALLSRRSGRDEPLGFGIGDMRDLLTPVAFFIAGMVANYVTERFLDSLIEYGKPRLTRLFSRWLKKDGEPAIVTVTLTAEQADEVRHFTMEKAREGGLSDTAASEVADAVVGVLFQGSETTTHWRYKKDRNKL